MLNIDFPPWFLSLFLAPLGLVLGSFGNVLIYRLPQEKKADRDVVKTPSHCPKCNARIRWKHNIPLISWIWLRGKCADCASPISIRYPLVELISGLIFAASPWLFPFGTLIWLKSVICAYSLLLLFFTDFTEFILPNSIQFPLMILGFLFTIPQMIWPLHSIQIQAGNWNVLSASTFANCLQTAPAWSPVEPFTITWKQSLLGMLLGYGLPWIFNSLYKLIRKTDGLGMGDFKMLAWLGAFWGSTAMLGILFGASLLAVIYALPLIIRGKLKGSSMLPLGCFLAIAVWPVLFYGSTIWDTYLNWLNDLWK